MVGGKAPRREHTPKLYMAAELLGDYIIQEII